MIVHENPWFHVLKEDGFHFVVEPADKVNAAILTVLGDNLLLLEMDRISQGNSTFEIPRGYAEAGESANQCAARELLEETGFTVSPEALELLGYVRPDTGILRSRVAIYFARIPAGSPQAKRDAEARSLVLVPMSDLTTTLLSGFIEDGFTLSALALLAARPVDPIVPDCTV
jgi:ADP-ribose pyrophosphatase